MSATIKSLVSKKRRRFQQEGFDLDLTYILGNLIAMGYPGTKLEGIYRNNIEDVTKFLEQKHKGHYKIYNLCEERSYDTCKFKTGEVVKFPFVDHNPPKMGMIPEICQDMDQFLSVNSENVVAVHCKAGKGRTGVMICCYLLHSGQCKTAREALEFYAKQRTRDSKGVTIPSQQRYVKFYEYLLQSPQVIYKPRPMHLTMIRLEGHLLEHSKVFLQVTLTAGDKIFTTSNVEWKHSNNCASSSTSSGGKKSTSGGGGASTSTSAASTSSSTDSHLHQPLSSENSSTFSSPSSCGYYSTTNHLSIELEEPLLLTGDIKLEVSSKPGKLSKKQKLFHCWFNTFFVDGIQQQRCGEKNGCSGRMEDGSCANNGSCNSADCKGHQDSLLTTGSANVVKRDSLGVSENNCCSVKVKFSRIETDKLGNQKNKHIDRTMSCPPPSDTNRPRLPVDWNVYNREPPFNRELDNLDDPCRTPTNSFKQTQGPVQPQNYYTMIFSKSELDKAHKDKGKVFSADFAVHLLFTEPDPASYSSDYSSSSLSSHASRSSFGGGGSSSSSGSAATTVNQQQLSGKKSHKTPSDQQNQHKGGLLKTTRTTSDMMAQLSSCITAEDDDDYVFGHDQQRSHRRHHHHQAGADTTDGNGGGIRLNRNHSSTSSCSESSSSASSENNSSCSNSSSTENCSQVVHHNNNKK